MRSLLHFDVRPNGRVAVAEVPPVGAETIFSENYIVNRADVEEPGHIARDTWPLPIGSIITFTPSQPPNASPLTFEVQRIGPYDPPAHGNIVVFCTRLT